MTATETLEILRQAVEGHEPSPVGLAGDPARAAVAALFEPRDDDLHLLFIRRAEDDRDPWSGQMGFPGGFKENEDPDLLAAARREVHEELDVDLGESADLLGRLDDVQGVARGRKLSLVITPFLFVLREPVVPRPNHEVQEVVWVPLGFLRDPQNETTTAWERPGEPRVLLPAFVWQERTIWGLTFRMVRNLLDILREASLSRS